MPPGEIRSAGLFVGVDLPSRAVATRVVHEMRRHGVLIGTTGRDSNILKIRPPLTITTAEVDVLLDALRDSL